MSILSSTNSGINGLHDAHSFAKAVIDVMHANTEKLHKLSFRELYTIRVPLIWYNTDGHASIWRYVDLNFNEMLLELGAVDTHQIEKVLEFNIDDVKKHWNVDIDIAASVRTVRNTPYFA